MSDEQAVEIVDEKTGEVIEVDKSLVFGTKDPDGIIEKATKVANKLVDIVEKAKLYSMIKDRKYVKAEGWTTMAAMLGVFPSVTECIRLERADEVAYASKVVLRTVSGAVVGSGEAICSDKERSWGGRDEYAVKSMSQTRALGKACRISFSWIMALAGYEPTPAEEMVNELPQRVVAMPRAKEVPQTEEVKSDGPRLDSAGPQPDVPSGVEGGPGLPDTGEPQSKFFVKLHATARTKKVNAEKMKRAIKLLFNKDSSKDLTDSECTLLIKQLESGAIR